MHKVCTVVPTYLYKFDYAMNFLKSHNENLETDLYFVFSTVEEEQLFRYAVMMNRDFKDNSYKNYKYLIVKGVGGSGLITQKKLWAVNELVKTYDYVAVLDDESLVVKSFDPNVVYKEIAEARSFKSNRRNDHLYHLKSVAEKMNLVDNERLIEQTDNFTQYWWFNELCVYDAKYFKEFFDWLISHPNLKELLSSFECFDYLLYSIWLICNKEFTLDKRMQEYSFGAGAIETNYDDDEISYAFKSYADRNVNHNNIDHIKVQIMLDRTEEFVKKLGNKTLI